MKGARRVREAVRENGATTVVTASRADFHRPATPLIVGFIDEYRQVYGVESICRALSAHGIQIAPRTYRKARRRPPSARDIADAHVENALRDLAGQPEEMYGRRKMTPLSAPEGPSSRLLHRGSDNA